MRAYDNILNISYHTFVETALLKYKTYVTMLHKCCPFLVSIVNNAAYIINNLIARFGDKYWFSTQICLDKYVGMFKMLTSSHIKTDFQTRSIGGSTPKWSITCDIDKRPH